MKNIFSIIAVLFCLQLQAQPPRNVPVNPDSIKLGYLSNGVVVYSTIGELTRTKTPLAKHILDSIALRGLINTNTTAISNEVSNRIAADNLKLDRSDSVLANRITANAAATVTNANDIATKSTIVPTYKLTAQKIIQLQRAKGALPVAMTSPPTVTQSATTTITGTTVTYTDTSFQYLASVPSAGYASGYTGGNIQQNGYKTGGVIDIYFSTDAPQLEIVTYQTPDKIRILVDGQAVSLAPIVFNASYASDFIKLDFTTSAVRTIRMEFSLGSTLNGVKIPTNYSIWNPSIEAPVRGMITGDSYTAGGYGDGTFNKHQGYARNVGYRLGIADWFEAGKAGENYASFFTRAAIDVIPYAPDYLIVAEGINDVNTNTTTLQTTVTNGYATLLASLPNTIITVIGPWRAPGLNPPTAVATAIKNGVLAQTSAIANGRIRYVDTYSENWQQIAGKVGATSGTGNSNIYIGSDNQHPVQAGHDYLGQRVYTAAMKHLSSIAN